MELDTIRNFADPFFDIAQKSMPRDMRRALYLAEFIWHMNGELRMAMQRIVAYHVTDFSFGSPRLGVDDIVDDSEQDSWTEAVDKMHLLAETQAALLDMLCYGNAFRSVAQRFTRYLKCPCNKAVYPLKTIMDTKQFEFRFEIPKFVARCPRCQQRRPWKVWDVAKPGVEGCAIARWNVHQMQLLHDEISGETQYYWRIPEDYKARLRRGNPIHLLNVPMSILEAAAGNLAYKFDDGVICHLKETPLSGVLHNGWGIPRALTNYRQVLNVQTLRRYNEAIINDYIIPFRLLTPAPRPGAGSAAMGATMDPMMNFDMGDFGSMVRRMVSQRRRDPAAWHTLPYPVQYQALGGDAKALAPTEMLDQALDSLLNSIGTPVELYKGTMQLQAAPVSLRLFEATWRPLVTTANDFISFVVRKTAALMQWTPMKISLVKSTIADDIQKQMAQLQLMQANLVSGRTAYNSIGLDYSAEQDRIANEAVETAKRQQRTQEVMEAMGYAKQLSQGQPQQGAPGAPGAPGGQPGQPGAGGQMGGNDIVGQYLAQFDANTNVSLPDLQAAAQEIAATLVNLPELDRRRQLQTLRQRNMALHSMVTAQMEKLRYDMRMQGGQQIAQQQAQGAGNPGQI